MKKLYAIQTTMRNLKNSRFSFVKVMLLLAIMIAFLSNVFSVNAGDVQPKNVTANEGDQSVEVSASTSVNEQVTASDPMDAGVMNVDVTASAEGLQANNIDERVQFSGLFVPVSEQATTSDNDLTISRAGVMNDMTASAEGLQANNFRAKEGNFNVLASEVEQAINRLPVAFQRSAGLTRAALYGNLAVGGGAFAGANGAIAIGQHGRPGSSGGVVYEAPQTRAENSIAIGHYIFIPAEGRFAVAIGNYAEAKREDSVALGHSAKVKVSEGVALGSMSIANVKGGIAGYDPKTGKASSSRSIAWQSTSGAVSIGNDEFQRTRQIVGVAAGTGDTDAVNVAQLKELRGMIKQGGGWELSVDGADNTTISSGDKLDFSAGSENFSITKGDKDNKLKFDLAQSIVVDKIQVGDNILDVTGLVIANGPTITTSGIDAGGKKIQAVENGGISENSTDAVNGSQLYSLGSEVAKTFGGGAGYEGGKWTAPKFTVKTVNEDGSAVEEQSYETVAAAFAGVGDSFEKVKDSFANIKNEITKEIEKEITTVQGDALLWSEKDHAFVAQHGEEGHKTNSKIKYLANGEISENSTDAVNGSQLYSLGSEVAKTFGGNASYEGGKWTAPTFTVKAVKEDGQTEDKDYHDVVSAFTGVGSSFTNLHKEITKEINNAVTKVEGNSLIKQDKNADPITIGKETNGTVINVANTSGVNRVISGVGEAKDNNDAVNKGQLEKGLKDLSSSLQSDDSAVVHYDKTGDDNNTINYTSVTLGKGQGSSPVGLHNVADGKIGEESHDAINGSQINTISGDVAKFLGGEAAFNSGTFTGPTYKLSKLSEDGAAEETSYDNVGSAFAGLDTSVKNVNTHLTNEVKKFEEKITNITQEVQGDALLWNRSKGAFVATHGEKDSKTNSKITSLLDGTINENSTDAVTGKQLHTLGDKVAKTFGGGAGYEGGKWTAPKFTVKTVNEDGSAVEEQSYETVAAAFAGVGDSFEKVKDSFANIKNEITKEIEKEITTVQGDALLWSEKDHAFVAQHGEEGHKTNSKIKYLANGEISENSTDAVNGSQLYSLGSEVAKTFGGNASYEGGKWTAPTFTVKAVKEDGQTEDKDYHDVVSAFTGVGSSFTNLHKEITKEINNAVTKVEGDSLIKQDKNADPITIGKETNGTVINVANTSGVNRVISGVGDAKDNNDAVNKGQLEKGLKDLSSSLQSDDSAVVHYDKTGDDNNTINYTSVTLGKGQGSSPVGLHNVANGKIGEESHDAINGSQINTISGDVAKFLGGEAAFNSGTFTGPTYKLSKLSEDGAAEETSYDNVGSAFAGLDTSVKNVNTHLTNEVKKFEEKITNITQEVQGDALLWDRSKGAFVATHGEKDSKTNSKITSLLDGTINENSTDAVTGKQLHTLGDKVAKTFGGNASYAEGKWTAPKFMVKTVNEDGSAVEEQSYETVAAAFAGVGDSFEKVKDSFANIKNEITKEIEKKLPLFKVMPCCGAKRIMPL
ncbi:surface protein/Bartonella adhesin [Bartonella vinsonii subsp. berkhoffii str. Tweed]|uniref:Surface protein/Bartonella adhesin n=1 Tax=Bartonella vinsonii subsp. berkhoffii str. Tweed TaxID=1094502 RepID=N6VQR7_BARVB|nr:hypothetical protein [Bartonella vinsonii]ENN95481.1 surface protein/Bartonella adhesin [Bartonella vinsonii subsp. berkhoffii str. Tweed]